MASSDDPPDVFGGNQGYQLDGELVKAGLILPLTEYAKAYGWEDSYSPETLQQFEWTDDGRTFGEGTLWGVAQTGQSIGVFANKKKLADAGVDPASLKTFDDFDAALAKLRVVAAGRRAGGRARQQGPVRRDCTCGAASRAPTSRPRRSATGSSSTTARRSTRRATVTSLEKLKEWADKGYFGKPDHYNSRNDSGRGDRVRQGRGRADDRRQLERRDGARRARRRRRVLQHAARRERRRGRDRLDQRADAHLRQDASSPTWRRRTSTRSPGRTPARSSSTTQQVPAVTDGTAELTDPLGQEVKAGWEQLVESGGLTLYPDWSSPTMLADHGPVASRRCWSGGPRRRTSRSASRRTGRATTRSSQG